MMGILLYRSSDISPAPLLPAEELGGTEHQYVTLH